MTMQAIILAGGLGTRLKDIIKDCPKPMADINGKPFLEYVLTFLEKQGIDRTIFSVGYKSRVIKDYFGENFNNMKLIYSVEHQLLGTGGAIKRGLDFVKDGDVFVVNGDTFFDIDLKKFYQFHKEKKADLTIALKIIDHSDRYGIMKIDKNFQIKNFTEKKCKNKKALINGGIYVLNKDFFLSFNLPEKFSFEKDFLEKYYNKCRFYGVPFDAYFIDIGVPDDYKRARKELEGVFSTYP